MSGNGAPTGPRNAYSDRERLLAHMNAGGEYSTEELAVAMRWTITRTMTTMQNLATSDTVKCKDVKYWSIKR